MRVNPSAHGHITEEFYDTYSLPCGGSQTTHTDCTCSFHHKQTLIQRFLLQPAWKPLCFPVHAAKYFTDGTEA